VEFAYRARETISTSDTNSVPISFTVFPLFRPTQIVKVRLFMCLGFRAVHRISRIATCHWTAQQVR